MSHANAFNKLPVFNGLPASPSSPNTPRRSSAQQLRLSGPASTSNGVIYRNGTHNTLPPVSTPAPDAYLSNTDTTSPHVVSAQIIARHPWLKLTTFDIKYCISMAMAPHLTSNLIIDIQGLLHAHMHTVGNYLAKPHATPQDIQDVCAHAQQTADIIQYKQQHLGVNHASLQELMNKTVAELQNMPNSYSLSGYTGIIAQYFAQLGGILPGELQKSQEAAIIDTSKTEGLRNIVPAHQGILAWMMWYQCHPKAQTQDMKVDLTNYLNGEGRALRDALVPNYQHIAPRMRTSADYYKATAAIAHDAAQNFQHFVDFGALGETPKKYILGLFYDKTHKQVCGVDASRQIQAIPRENIHAVFTGMNFNWEGLRTKSQ